MESQLKFFTRNWVNGDMGEEEFDAVPLAYRRHLDALDLPGSVRELAELGPHDAYILDVVQKPLLGTVNVRLRCGDLQAGYFDALLNFSGVTIQPVDAETLAGAIHPAHFEVLYDEVDRAPKPWV
jgi:hypothetical protein